jgi:hypothetical protein
MDVWGEGRRLALCDGHLACPSLAIVPERETYAWPWFASPLEVSKCLPAASGCGYVTCSQSFNRTFFSIRANHQCQDGEDGKNGK